MYRDPLAGPIAERSVPITVLVSIVTLVLCVGVYVNACHRLPVKSFRSLRHQIRVTLLANKLSI